MQDKIDELIIKATFDEVFDKRKFAELIIKECVDLLDEHRAEYKSPCSYESTEYYVKCAAKVDALDFAVGSIKNRFGVLKYAENF